MKILLDPGVCVELVYEEIYDRACSQAKCFFVTGSQLRSREHAPAVFARAEVDWGRPTAFQLFMSDE